jgi:hypothetical protein
MVLDLASGKMYFSAGTDVIQRANLDGTGLINLVSAPGVIDIALDLADGKIYWTTGSDGTINRANLDGTGVTNLVFKGGTETAGIALDVAGGKMFWTTGLEGTIVRANLDGTERTNLVIGLRDSDGIALDLANGKMYWADRSYPNVSNGDIRRANLDGSGMETLVSNVTGPISVSLDLSTRFTSQTYSNGQLYIQLSGTVGQSVVVQTSTDLVNWNSLNTNIFGSGALILSYTNNLNQPYGFYRALLLQ